MTEKNEPAFPVTEQHGANSGCTGMTLRDYFAGKALPIVYNKVKEALERDASWDSLNHIEREMIAEDSYLMADAMLKARGEQ